MTQYERGFMLSGTYAVEADGEVFADGHSSVSYKGTDKKKTKRGGSTVWVKVIEKKHRGGGPDERAEREIAALRMLRKARAVGCATVVDFLQSRTKYFIVTSAPPAALSLLDHLQQHGVCTEAFARQVFKSAVKAVEDMHRSRVCHRALSLENVWLRDPAGTDVHIVDFSSASTAQPQALLSELPALNSFSAPEILARQLYTAEAADAWSLGAVLYALLVGKLPFSDASSQDGLLRCIRTNRRPVFPAGLSADARDLVSALLQICPEDRMRVEAALQHPWFESSSPSTSSCSQRSSMYSDSETLPSTPGGAVPCLSPTEA
ncbi:putative CBL-interacting protein kinase 27 [Diplonema papillatum]|nr:putative CBL-interacting protein kinase 27 [Diplonema papillatum]